MAEVRVDTNVQELMQTLSRAKRRQLPFAMQNAVNNMAFDIKDQELKKLDRYFDIRTGWLRSTKGTIVQKARKTDFPDIAATYSIKNEVAAKSVTGEDRRKSGNERLAVPLSEAAAGGQSTRERIGTPKETLPLSKQPQRFVKDKVRTKRNSGRKKKPKPFFMTGTGGTDMVAIRTGQDRLPIKPLYVLKDEVEMEKKWPLDENAQAYVSANYERQLNIELEKAMESAKRKGKL